MLLGLVAAETIGEGEADDSVKVHVRPPVLFLTARSAVNDVVEGFELGGNDYLKKPFFHPSTSASNASLKYLSNHSAG